MRFIIIAVPPEPLAGQIRSLQEFLAGEAKAWEALRYPPHVTLRTGMLCPEDEADEAVRAFLEHARGFCPVEIASSGSLASGYRDSAGTERGFLGYRVELTDGLRALHQGLLAFEPWRKGPQGTYNPHVSLCYHDVTPGEARSLLREHRNRIESLSPAWRADSVELWEPAGDTWRFRARAGLS